MLPHTINHTPTHLSHASTHRRHTRMHSYTLTPSSAIHTTHSLNTPSHTVQPYTLHMHPTHPHTPPHTTHTLVQYHCRTLWCPSQVRRRVGWGNLLRSHQRGLPTLHPGPPLRKREEAEGGSYWWDCNNLSMYLIKYIYIYIYIYMGWHKTNSFFSSNWYNPETIKDAYLLLRLFYLGTLFAIILKIS